MLKIAKSAHNKVLQSDKMPPVRTTFCRGVQRLQH